MKIPKEMRCQNCSDSLCECYAPGPTKCDPVILGYAQKAFRGPPLEKEDAPPLQGASEAYTDQQPKRSWNNIPMQPLPGGGWTAGPFLMARVPPPMRLVGPPVSRRRQRKLGIERFVPGIGYEKRSCSRCHTHLWVGPNQIAYLEAAPKTEVICLTCIGPELKAGTVAFTHFGGRGGGYHYADGRYWGPPEEHGN